MRVTQPFTGGRLYHRTLRLASGVAEYQEFRMRAMTARCIATGKNRLPMN